VCIGYDLWDGFARVDVVRPSSHCAPDRGLLSSHGCRWRSVPHGWVTSQRHWQWQLQFAVAVCGSAMPCISSLV
jgi:hypothetical protein